jgi:hypothetical protein
MKTIKNVSHVDCELKTNGRLTCLVRDFEGNYHRKNFDEQMGNIGDLKIGKPCGSIHPNVGPSLGLSLTFEREDDAKCELQGDELHCYDKTSVNIGKEYNERKYYGTLEGDVSRQ